MYGLPENFILIYNNTDMDTMKFRTCVLTRFANRLLDH